MLSASLRYTVAGPEELEVAWAEHCVGRPSVTNDDYDGGDRLTGARPLVDATLYGTGVMPAVEEATRLCVDDRFDLARRLLREVTSSSRASRVAPSIGMGGRTAPRWKAPGSAKGRMLQRLNDWPFGEGQETQAVRGAVTTSKLPRVASAARPLTQESAMTRASSVRLLDLSQKQQGVVASRPRSSASTLAESGGLPLSKSSTEFFWNGRIG